MNEHVAFGLVSSFHYESLAKEEGAVELIQITRNRITTEIQTPPPLSAMAR